MKKVMVFMIMGIMMVSSQNRPEKRLSDCAEAGAMSEAVCCLSVPDPLPAASPVREQREPLLLLRILTEL